MDPNCLRGAVGGKQGPFEMPLVILPHEFLKAACELPVAVSRSEPGFLRGTSFGADSQIAEVRTPFECAANVAHCMIHTNLVLAPMRRFEHSLCQLYHQSPDADPTGMAIVCAEDRALNIGLRRVVFGTQRKVAEGMGNLHSSQSVMKMHIDSGIEGIVGVEDAGGLVVNLVARR